MRGSEEPAIWPGRRVRRRLAAGVAIAASALLLGASEARAGTYTVAQCGWRIGVDADWEGSAGAGKFRPGSRCPAAGSGDPFEVIQIGSLTRPAAGSVAGTGFARWRWTAPPGTGILSVRGKSWASLRDGFQHRLGTGGTGGFAVFASAGRSDAAPRAFAAGFRGRRRTFESRLLCARPQGSRCALRPASSASLRSLLLTIADDSAPHPRLGGGLAARVWRRGTQEAQIDATDLGSGVRFAETLIDGARVAGSRQTCSERRIGAGWVATRMRPCGLRWIASQAVRTERLSDGRHRLRTCAVDFAGNRDCTDPRPLRTDNTAPAAPRGIGLRGGGGWRRRNAFAAVWDNPRQRPGSPIAGVAYRLAGPDGYDSGVLRRESGGDSSPSAISRSPHQGPTRSRSGSGTRLATSRLPTPPPSRSSSTTSRPPLPSATVTGATRSGSRRSSPMRTPARQAVRSPSAGPGPGAGGGCRPPWVIRRRAPRGRTWSPTSPPSGCGPAATASASRPWTQPAIAPPPAGGGTAARCS